MNKSCAFFSPTATAETYFPSLCVCVIALHSQMPLNIFDTLTNSPFQCSHHGYSQEMYKKEEEAGMEDKQREARLPRWVVPHRLTSEIYLTSSKTSSGPWYLFREKTLSPKGFWKTTAKMRLLSLQLRNSNNHRRSTLSVVLIIGWKSPKEGLISLI